MTTENLILHTLGMFKDGLTLHFLEHELRKVSKQEINKALKALLDKGLIKKEPQYKLNDISAFTFKRKATKTDIRKAEQRIKLNEVPKSYTKIKLL